MVLETLYRHRKLLFRSRHISIAKTSTQDAAIIIIRGELVGKSEVQSFVALILSCAEVMVFLLGAHSIPNLFTCLVPPCIVDLNEDGDHDVPCHNCKKNFVSLAVVRFIIRSVDLEKKIC